MFVISSLIGRPSVIVCTLLGALTTSSQTLATQAAPTVQTEEVLSIAGITPDHKIKLVNISNKSISGFTLENLVPKSEWFGFVGSDLLEDPPMQPGETDQSMQIWPEISNESQIRVAAIIFADGTHVGHVVDKLCDNTDVVTCIFDTRRGWADAFALLVEQVQALPPTAVAITSFLAKAPPASPPKTTPGKHNSAYERAFNSELSLSQSAMQERQNDVTSGKTTAAAVVKEMKGRWIKGAAAMREAATDRGEWQ